MEAGYYWIVRKDCEEAEVAYCAGDLDSAWFITGSDMTFRRSDIERIGARLTPTIRWSPKKEDNESRKPR